jgi:hypothetical protein
MLNDSIKNEPSAPTKARRAECPSETFPLKFVVHRILIRATYLKALSAELLHPTETILKRYIYIGK